MQRTSTVYESIGSDASQLEKITVTGSRIPTTANDASQPILRLSREELQRTGYTNLGEILQNLPVAGSAVNATVSTDIANAAGTEFNLRHLGADRTLVLVNGRRWLGGVGIFRTSTPDLSAIPIAIIERLEILKDGASAVYGTDAVAGVLNIVTRRNFDSTEVFARAGQFLGENDGKAREFGLSHGAVGDQGSWFVGLSFAEDLGVQAKDRRLGRQPVLGTGVTRGDAYNQQGRFLFVPDAATVNLPCAAQGFCDLTLIDGEDGVEQSDFRPYIPAQDNYNFSLDYPLSFATERWSIFSSAQRDFGSKISGTAEAFASRRSAFQPFPDFLGALFLGDLGTPPPYNAVFVSADNPFNPFRQDIGRGDPATGVGTGSVLRIATERGFAGIDYRIEDLRLALALQGESGVVGQWELGGVTHRSSNDMRSDDVQLSHLARGLGPLADCQAQPGCVPINVFGGRGVDGQGSMTDVMVDYISRTGRFDTLNQGWQLYWHANQSAFEFPVGPLELAYGLEYRDDSYRFVPDALTQSGDSAFGELLAGQGSQQVFEGFWEAKIPLLRQRPWAEQLSVNLASRYSHYSRVGDVHKARAGFDWQLTEQLAWRATWSQAFRVAPLGLQYFGGGPLFVAVTDPCSQWQDSEDANIRQNCAALGVPEDYAQPAGMLRYFNRGNEQLEPEESDTVTASLVWQPQFIDDFSLVLDWYRTDVDQSISQFRPQFVLDACYGQSQPGITCAFIEREEQSGLIQQVDLPYANLDRTQLRGFDLTLAWAKPLPAAWGKINTSLVLARLMSYQNEILQSDGSRQVQRLDGTNEGSIDGVAYPKWKAQAHIGWSQNQLQVSWLARYISSLTERCDDGVEPSLVELGLCSDPNHPNGPRNRLSSVMFHDVQMNYSWPQSPLSLQLGINNVFNKQPPAAVSGTLASFNAGLYDIPGRFAYLGLRWTLK
ncbi:MAG: TonB-dependent receptor domain-containing protein [Oceanococcus sp.]